MNFVPAKCWLMLLMMSAVTTINASQEEQRASQEKNKTQVANKLPEVTVKSTTESFLPKNTTTGSKINVPLIEVPQTVNVITRPEMNARLVQNISQAVSYTPGVLTEMFGPSMRDDYFNIRGFDAPQFLDGLMLQGVNYANLRIEPYGMESVEVLKGPASVLYGQSSPGGLVNMISKRPTAVPLRELFITGGSFDRIQGGVDFSGAVDKESKFLYRITGLVRDSNTQINHAQENRYFIAPSIAWKPTPDTVITVLSHFQKDDAGSTLQALPAEGTLLSNPNGRIPTSRFLGEPGYDRFQKDQFTVGYAFEHRLSDKWKIEQNLRYADVSTNYPVTFFFDYLRDEESGLPIDSRTIMRDAGLYRDKAGTFTMDTRLLGIFDTGPVNHRTLFGIDYRHLSGSNKRGLSAAPDLDVYDPVYGQPFDRPVIDFVSKQQREQIGIYGQDLIKYNRFLLTLNARYDFANSIVRNNDSFAGEVTNTRQNKGAFTYRTGISYLFDNGIVPYASYSTSFQPPVGISFSGTPFKPTTGNQYEVGIKYQPTNFNALITASAFHITQQNVITPDLTPGHFGFDVQTGEARSRGFEIEAKTNLALGLSLTAGYSFLDTKVTKSDNPDELGNRLSLQPRHQGSAWLDYTFQNGPLTGLGLGWGMRHIGSNFGDLTNSLRAPSYTLFDAAVRYDLKHVHNWLYGAHLSVNMNNVMDNEYIATCTDGFSCYYGARRTVYATLRFNW
jgi:iron complex outermembrane receptor protein